jgi:hypothetical protein
MLGTLPDQCDANNLQGMQSTSSAMMKRTGLRNPPVNPNSPLLASSKAVKAESSCAMASGHLEMC